MERVKYLEFLLQEELVQNLPMLFSCRYCGLQVCSEQKYLISLSLNPAKHFQKLLPTSITTENGLNTYLDLLHYCGKREIDYSENASGERIDATGKLLHLLISSDHVQLLH